MKRLLIIFMISIILICLFKKKREFFTNYFIHEIKKSKHFRHYINSISNEIKKVKLPGFKINDNFKESYIKNLFSLTNEEQQKIDRYTSICDKKLRRVNLSIFFRYPWKIVKSNNNLELGMPFTLHDIIIIPSYMINRLNEHTINNNFIDTLIHEKTHVIQRFNQTKFNTFYMKTYPFLKKTIYKLPTELHKNNMVNPDSNGQYWLYKFNNSLFYVFLKYKRRGRVTSYAVDKNNIEADLDYLKKIYKFNPSTSVYHPNEIFAYELASQILNKNISNNYFRFLITF
jgi:hypothetical protein